jgi:hypothetical protein
MSLPNPVPGVDPGPDYANNLANSLNIIDQHNHSPGNGVLIQPNGMNINIDLPFGNNNATGLRSARFVSQSAPLSLGADLGCLYVSGNELYYNDEAGNRVQITASGAVNATASGIASGTASAAFSSGVLVVKSTSTSGANVLMKSLELTNSGNLTNILTLAAPTLSGGITETLPTPPGATSFMQMDSSGNMSASVAVSGGIGTSNIGNGQVTPAKIAASNYQVSGSVNFSSSGTSLQTVTGATVTITTSGRPLIIGFQSDAGIVAGEISIGGATNLNFYIDGTLISTSLIPYNLPANCLPFFYPGASAGSHTITVKVQPASGTVTISGIVLYAYELY